MTREKDIYKITIVGSIVNVLLTLLKLVAGILGASSAMIADAVHSFSDLLTDVIVIVFVRLSKRPADSDHHYGHGKYETLATVIVGTALLIAGGILLTGGVKRIISVLNGEVLREPELIALWAALISIIAKEIVYQMTVRVAKRVASPVLQANAWHHRSDALSSVAAALGIGGALVFGGKWTVLDPIAAVLVSLLIMVTAIRLIYGAIQELLEKSLPESVEKEIREIVSMDKQMSELHNLRTRRVGTIYSIEMHIRMRGDITLNEAHCHSMQLEQHLRERFGEGTLVNIHVEPLKVNGQYLSSSEDK